MLNITTIKNSQHARSHLGPAEYYQSGDKIAFLTAWYGAGATTLGLSGEVDMQHLVDLLDGKISAEIHLGMGGNEKLEHQTGWYLTFFAPKSLSVLSIVGGDTRLVAAHQKAATSALEVVEKEFVLTRQQVAKDEFVDINSGNLIAAQFLHALSRVNDPQLHTHCVVVNATLQKSGQWGRIHSTNIHDHKMLIGQIYRDELALQVQYLGYKLAAKPQHGFFEIKGVPAEVIENFSKKSETSEDLARENPAVLYKRWIGESESLGFDVHKMQLLRDASNLANTRNRDLPLAGR